MAESFTDRVRGKALAFVQSFWAIGYALGAAITAVVLPRFGWRAVFFVGVFPALLTLWVRRSVKEPETFERERQPSPSPWQIFKGPLRHGTVVCADHERGRAVRLVGALYLDAAFPLSARGAGRPWAEHREHPSVWTIVMQAGTFAGYISFGYMAERFGQKRTYIGFLVVAALSVPVFASVASAWAVLAVGPVVGFFGTGYFSGFSAITSDLFPTPAARHRDGVRLQHWARGERSRTLPDRAAE